MHTISAASTPFFRHTLPRIIYGGAGVVSIAAVGAALVQGNAWLLGAPVVTWVAAAVLVRQELHVLADEVIDGGGYLQIRRDGIDHRVLPLDVECVNRREQANPPRIRLRLARPSPLGREVEFAVDGSRLQALGDDLARRFSPHAGGPTT